MRMRNTGGVAWIALASVLAVPAHAQTTVAGFTPGAFQVTQSGAAEYRIPIKMPPGIAGMEPKLALAYNSQAGNGLLGVGWNLEGLSAIGRCPRTMAQDGVRGSVNYDPNDRYCLDGQRLMVVSGTYGADGAEYRTERESFTKVVSYGVAGNGPAWFKAWTKSGQIIEYGNTPDSRIKAQGKPTVRVWAVNKISDTAGNYFTVSYIEDNAQGAFQFAGIQYGGNQNSGITADKSAEFIYEPRPDMAYSYVGGSMIRTTARLSLVRLRHSGTTVKEYRLSYQYASGPNTSQLTSVTECDANQSCLPATTFAWTNAGATGLSSPAGWWPGYGGWCDPGHLRYGDYNGDGRQDLSCHSDDGRHIIAFSNGDGTFGSPGWWNAGAWCDPAHLRTGDYNGDGKLDLSCHSDDGRHIVAFSNGDGSFGSPGWWAAGPWCDPAHLRTGDYNGDGRLDLSCHSDGGGHIVAFSNGDGSFSSPGWWNAGPWCDPAHLRIEGDFNGDGKLDLSCHSDDGRHIVAFSNGDGSFSSPGWWGTLCEPSRMTLGDFNGDGLTDLHCHGTDGRHLIAFSAGDGNFSIPNNIWWPGYGAWCDDSMFLRFGDFNGDGKQDLICHGSDGRHIVAYSAGDGTFMSPGWWPTAWCDPPHLERGGDFNGDGRKGDLICNGDDGRHVVAFHVENLNLVSSLVSSAGVQVGISYKSISDSSIHTRDNGTPYPYRDIQGPLFVVTSASVSNGIGGARVESYLYGGAKSELSGRGFLGFRWLESTDQQTGIKARTEFRLDWPYLGMPSLARRAQSSGVELSLVMNTFGCMNPASGAACAVTPGNRYFPFLSQSLEAGNDLNGAALPTVTTTNSGFDLYGNLGSITVSTGDGYSKTTTNIYANDLPNWLLGRLTRSTVQSTTP